MGRVWIRWTALVSLLTFTLVMATSSADAAELQVAPVHFSALASDFSGFVRETFADAVSVPQQKSGTTAGHAGVAPANKAGKGAGHAPGVAKGQVPLATAPDLRKTGSGLSGHPYTGFNAKTSTRNALKSTAYSNYYNNADGSFTVDASSAPVNFKSSGGSWHPIVTTLVAGSGGRLSPKATGLPVSFSDGAGASGSLSPSTRSPAGSDVDAAPLFADVSLGTGESVGWSLQGAANVTPTVSGSTATYSDVLPDTSLELTSSDLGVKESLVLASADAGDTWTFPLSLTGVSLVDDPQYGWELVDGTGTAVGYLPAPYAFDATPASADGGQVTGTASYSLSTSDSGAQSLILTLDSTWLNDPARLFPVTIDPSVYYTSGESTYVTGLLDDGVLTGGSAYTSDNAGSTFLQSGQDPGNTNHYARSFVWISSQVLPVASGDHVSSASIGLYDAWASTSAAEPVDVYPITEKWDPITTTTWPGPSIGASMGSADVTASRAAGNTSMSTSVFTYITVPISTTVANEWTSTDPGAYLGFAIGAPDTNNSLEWKQFDSMNVSGGDTPNISLTYVPDVAPEVTSLSPSSGTTESTLTPVLTATVADPDSWPGLPMTCQFALFPGSGGSTPLVTSGSSWVPCAWPVTSGELKWGQTYVWEARTSDGALASPWSQANSFTTTVPPPLLTSSLSQNSATAGFDPGIGNYTTSATDATVPGAGPALSIVRDYNSLDPRTGGAFGAGWSSVLDAKASEQYSPTSPTTVTSVTVTYPDGSEIGFGKNSDGTFSPPLGRFATFVAVTAGGYTLTDKNDTVYSFTTSLPSGVWGISSITNAQGQAEDFTWSGEHIMLMEDMVSQRSLTIGWTGNQVTEVTLPAPATGVSGAQWLYSYSGDELASVCSPMDIAPACTDYTYQSGTEYPSAVLDGGPADYWRLGDAAVGVTEAADQVLSNEGATNGTYANESSDPAGPLALSGSHAVSTAAAFTASSDSSVTLPHSLLIGQTNLSIALWFKTTSSGPLWCEQNAALPNVASNATCSLYVGTDGYLHGGYYAGNTSQFVSTVQVNNGAWHFVVLSGYGSSQQMFLDGSTAHVSGSISGQITNLAQLDDYLGAGYSSAGWPATTSSAQNWYFTGSISDVAFYDEGLTAAQVANLQQIATTPTAQLTQILRPSADDSPDPTTGITAQIHYSDVTGLVCKVTDQNGGVWKVGTPTVSGSSEVYRASVMASAPEGYWRLSDPPTYDSATDQVALDNTNTTYSGVHLGETDGELFPDSTVALFDGTSSYVQLPSDTLNTMTKGSVSLWFKAAGPGGVLLSTQVDPIGNGTTESPYAPELYVGSDGLLHGDFWYNSLAPMNSSAVVDDDKWHEVVLTGSTQSGNQTLYLDGSQIGTLSAGIVTTAETNAYVGVGYIGGGWPDEANQGRNGNEGYAQYFNGQIGEVALYPSQLSGQQVAAQWQAAKYAAGSASPMVSIPVTQPLTGPSGTTAGVETYEYDPDNGMREIAQIDPLGAKTTYGYDTSGFLDVTVNPDGDETIDGHDARGNTVSVTTCQNHVLQECSTSYSSYDIAYSTSSGVAITTTANLTSGSSSSVTFGSVNGTVVADPRDDVQVTTSDGRSASATDPTYETTSVLDAHGNLLSRTTPPVPGFPSGSTSTTVYTDGTTAFPAMAQMTTPGVPAQISPLFAVPAGLPWTETTAGGAVTQFKYYADGDLALKIDPDDTQETSYMYDGDGLMTNQTLTYVPTAPGVSPACTLSVSLCLVSETTSDTYNAVGQVTTTTDPEVTDAVNGAKVHTEKTTVTYNADGAPATSTVSDLTGGDDPRTTLTAYNQYGEILYTMDPQQYIDGDGASISPTLADATQYTYYPNGSKASETSPVGTVLNGSAGSSTTTDYGYDLDGRLQTTTLESYDDSLVGSPATGTLTEETRSYDPAGQLMSVVDGMGVATVYQYYDNGLTETVTRCSALQTGSATACVAPPTGSSFVEDSDSYDGAGNLTTQVTNNGATTTDYLFDAAGRQYETVLDPGGLDRTTTKSFDADDAVVAESSAGDGQSATTAYGYNADGAMTSESVLGANGNEFATAPSPSNQWKLNDGSGSTAANAITPANTATLGSTGAGWASDPNRGQVLAFNGSSGYASLPSSVVTTGSANLVIALRFKTDTTGGVLFSHSAAALSAGTTTSDYQPNIYVGADGKLVSGVGGFVESSGVVDDGAWHQVVLVASGTTATVYLDGSLVSSSTATPDSVAEPNVYIGAGFLGGGWPDQPNSSSNATVSYFNGDISDVQTYTAALTSLQVSAMYSSSASANNTTTWGLDGRNDAATMTDPLGNVTNYTYDAAGRQVTQTDPSVSVGKYTSGSGYSASAQRPTSYVGYDTFGDQVETRDPDGYETLALYDADGRQDATEEPTYAQPGSQNTSTFTQGSATESTVKYNELGQEIASYDPSGDETEYAYDQLGYQTAVQYPGLTPTATTYDADGQVMSETDPAGDTTESTWDYLGRQATSTVLVDGAPPTTAGCRENDTDTEASCNTTYNYNPAGFLSSQVSPGGVTTSYGYDDIGEQTSVTDDADQTSTTAYDFAGRAVQQTAPDGTYDTVTYDQAGNQVGTAAYSPGGTAQTWQAATYNADGDVLSQTDARNHTTTYGYDATGMLTSETQPTSSTESITVSYGYDADGNQTEYTPGNANAGTNGLTPTTDSTYTTYNTWDLPESTIEPATSTYDTAATSTTTVAYDQDGNAIEQDSPGGVVLLATYNHLGELTSQYADGSSPEATATATRTFGYTPDGQISWADTATVGTSGQADYQPSTTENFGYDTAGDLLSASGTGATGSQSASFTYDADGQMSSRVDASGTTGYTYDTDGRLSTLALPADAGGTTLSYAYTPDSPNYTITYGTSGDLEALDFNSLHQPSSDTLTNGSTSLGSIAYTYDQDGNEQTKDTTGFTGTVDNSYTYDWAGRLSTWSNTSGTTTYGYDQDSNRTTVESTMSGVQSNVFTYDSRDELTSQTVTGGAESYEHYSASGDLQSETTGAEGGNTLASYADDAYGQQINSGSDSYDYDALGRLNTQTTSTGSTTLSYSGTTNTIASDGTNDYVQDPSGALVATENPTADTSGLLWTDQHTDVVGEFNPTSTSLTGTETYDPLGNVLSTTGTAANLTVGYQSEWTDSTNGNVDMDARWYDPSTGQFMNKDTESNSATPNTANANPFAYGDEDPLGGTDPSGHRFAEDVNGRLFTGGTAKAVSAQISWVQKVQTAYAVAVAKYVQHVQSNVQLENSLMMKLMDSDPTAVADTCYGSSNASCVQNIKDANTDYWECTDSGVSCGGDYGIDFLPVGQATGDSWDFLAGMGSAIPSMLDMALEMANPMSAGTCSAAHVGCLPSATKAYGQWMQSLGVDTSSSNYGMGAIAGGLVIGVATGEATDILMAAETAEAVDGASDISDISEAADGTSDLDAAVSGDSTGEMAQFDSGVAGEMPTDLGAADEQSYINQETAPDAGTGKPTEPTTPKTKGSGSHGSDPVTQEVSDSTSDEVSPTTVDPGAPDPAPAVAPASEGSAADAGADGSAKPTNCGANSFLAGTPVLMADGATTPISQVKVGDQVETSVPGQAGLSVHTVQNVIVTYTDHDLVDVTVAPTSAASVSLAASSPAASTGSARAKGAPTKAAPARALALAGIRKAAFTLAAGLAAAAVGLGLAHSPSVAAPASFASPAVTVTAVTSSVPATGGVIHTTFLHPFYDETQASFVEAQYLHTGDLLQTPTGTAVITDLHLYHANTTTYDLTIAGLHTFYVVAGSVPVLVHNDDGCGPAANIAQVRNGLDGKHVTTGVPTDAGGSPIGPEFSSGNDSLSDRVNGLLRQLTGRGGNVSWWSASHAEPKIALWMNDSDVNFANVVINQDYVCGGGLGCEDIIPNILQQGRSMVIWYRDPDGILQSTEPLIGRAPR